MLKINLREGKTTFKGKNKMAVRRGRVGINSEAVDMVGKPSCRVGRIRLG